MTDYTHGKTIALAAALLVGAMASIPAQAETQTLTVDVAGATSYGYYGMPSNTVWDFYVGANAHIIANTYDVTLTANDPSAIWRMAVDFSDSSMNHGVFLVPGNGYPTLGTATASFSGGIDLTTIGADFNVGSDGILRVEFYDTFENSQIPGDVWDSGKLTFTYDVAAVPEPATYALMLAGLGVAGWAARRQKRSAQR